MVRDIVSEHITPRQFGLLGEPRVDVLELNIALDDMAKREKRSASEARGRMVSVSTTLK
jgi:K+-transporting ATPase ATPase C chain